MTMQFLINGADNDAPSVSAVNYNFIAAGHQSSWDATETNRAIPVAGAMTLQSLYVRLGTAPGVGKSYELAVMKNGVVTGLAVTISGTNTTGNLTGQAVAFAADDTISIRCTPSGTPTASPNVYWSIIAETSNDTFVIFGAMTSSPSNSAQNFVGPTLCAAGVGWSSTETNNPVVTPLAGTISRLTVKLGTAPGASKSREFGLLINASPSTLTTTISGTNTSNADTTHSPAIAAGDRLTLETTPSGTPASSALIFYSMLITPTTPGQSFIAAGNASTGMSTSVTNYVQLTGRASGTASTTEADHRMILAGGTVKSLYVFLTAVPGAGKSWTYKLRHEGADSGLSVVVADTNASANGATDVAVTPGDYYNYSITPSGTPATAGPHVGLLISFPVNQTLTGGGDIATGEAFGTGAILVGDVTLTGGGGIATGEAFGTGTIVNTQVLTGGGGIASEEAFDTGFIYHAVAMEFALFGTNSTSPSNSSTTNQYVNGSGSSPWSTEAGRQQPVAGPMTLKELHITLDAAPGAGKSRTFTIRKNGADTALTVTIADTATTGSITGQAVGFTAGDLVNLQTVPSGTPASAVYVTWSIKAETSNATQIAFGGASSNVDVSADSYLLPTATASITLPSSDAAGLGVVPLSGLLAQLYVRLTAAPGSGKSYTFTLMVNGSPTGLTTTISDAATSGQDTTHGVSVSPGDTLSLKCTPSGTPTAVNAVFGLMVIPTTPGEYMQLFGSASNPSSSSTTYAQLHGAGSWGTTESATKAIPVGFSGHLAKAIYVAVTTAPGSSKSRSFTLRDNGADTALTASLSGAATTANAAVNTALVAGHVYNYSTVPTNTPTSPTNGVHLGLLLMQTADQTMTDGGAIASGEAFGAGQINLELLVGGGIASGEAFGVGTILPGDVTLTGGGDIASGEAFGVGIILPGDVTLTGGGAIASGEAFGVGAILVGDVTLTDGGAIASGEAFGTGQINLEILDGGGIASGEAFGVGAILAGDVTLTDGGAIASGEAFGTGQINLELLAGGAIASGEAFGVGTILPGDVTLTGGGAIASGEVFGVGAINTGDNTLYDGGDIPSSEAFGVGAIITGAVTLTDGGAIASGEAFGVGLLNLTLADGGGIASAEAFGVGTLHQELLAGGAIASGEAFGTGQINLELLAGGAIASAEAFGVGAITTGAVTLTGGGDIATGEAFGIGAILVGDATLTNGGAIASGEAFGTGQINHGLIDGGAIASGEAFGTGQINLALLAGGDIASGEAFGVGQINLELLAGGGIASGEAFGVGFISYALTDGGDIASGETFGTGQINLELIGGGAIASGEAFGVGMILPGDVTLTNGGGITSGEAFGIGIIGAEVQLLTDGGAIASGEAFGVGAVVFPPPPTQIVFELNVRPVVYILPGEYELKVDCEMHTLVYTLSNQPLDVLPVPNLIYLVKTGHE